MKVDIPEEQWGAMVGAAVMSAITDENRDTLVKEAITHLLTPEKNHTYGRNRSPLQQAFDCAVANEARKCVADQLDSELGGKVSQIVQEAIAKAFADERRLKLIDNISDSIVKAFRVDGY